MKKVRLISIATILFFSMVTLYVRYGYTACLTEGESCFPYGYCCDPLYCSGCDGHDGVCANSCVDSSCCEFNAGEPVGLWCLPDRTKISQGICCDGTFRFNGDCCSEEDCLPTWTCVNHKCEPYGCISEGESCFPYGYCCDPLYCSGCDGHDGVCANSCVDSSCCEFNAGEPVGLWCLPDRANTNSGICCNGTFYSDGDCCGEEDCLPTWFCNENHMCEPPPDGMPTLSEWGIIIFMTIIMGIGVMMILRKRRMA